MERQRLTFLFEYLSIYLLWVEIKPPLPIKTKLKYVKMPIYSKLPLKERSTKCIILLPFLLSSQIKMLSLYPRREGYRFSALWLFMKYSRTRGSHRLWTRRDRFPSQGCGSGLTGSGSDSLEKKTEFRSEPQKKLDACFVSGLRLTRSGSDSLVEKNRIQIWTWILSEID